jgi:hypothetical protein
MPPGADEPYSFLGGKLGRRDVRTFFLPVCDPTKSIRRARHSERASEADHLLLASLAIGDAIRRVVKPSTPKPRPVKTSLSSPIKTTEGYSNENSTSFPVPPVPNCCRGR